MIHWNLEVAVKMTMFVRSCTVQQGLQISEMKENMQCIHDAREMKIDHAPPGRI